MANKALFNTKTSTNKNGLAVNEAGGAAYRLKDRAALAQLAATGCLSGTFYASAKDQLDQVKELADRISRSKGGTEFIAKLAIYARKSAFMKDMPALLLSYLAVRDPDLYERVFPVVMDNAKMIRNHVQIIRSGTIDGRKSLPRAMRRQLKAWFARRKNDRLFKDSVGNNPSMADVIKMVRPKPQDAEQEALYSYLIGRKTIKGALFNASDENLPQLVQDYEATKVALNSGNGSVKIPDVPFQMLDSLGLKDEHWAEIARNAKWQMTRMNINTFNRHGVFKNKALLNLVAQRLRDPAEIKKAKVFPYQLMAAYMNATNAPFEIKEALQDAMEIALENIPKIGGNIWLFPDVSGSMGSPITGRSGKPSAVKCVDVAALISAAFLRTNRQTKVMPFSNRLETQLAKRLNPRDSVMTNAQAFASCWGGGTNVSLGVKHLVDTKQDVDLVIYISDYESWLDGRSPYGYSGRSKTETMRHWDIIKKNNPNAKMVCIDIQPYGTTQAPNRDDIMNVGGFSDVVWDVIAQFAKHGRDGSHWVEVINQVDIPNKA